MCIYDIYIVRAIDRLDIFPNFYRLRNNDKNCMRLCYLTWCWWWYYDIMCCVLMWWYDVMMWMMWWGGDVMRWWCDDVMMWSGDDDVMCVTKGWCCSLASSSKWSQKFCGCMCQWKTAATTTSPHIIWETIGGVLKHLELWYICRALSMLNWICQS